MMLMPGTASADMEKRADGIRALIDAYPRRAGVTVQIPSLKPADYRDGPDPLRTIASEKITLTISRWYGNAPYVGRPFVYTWLVARDGPTYVATEAVIEYMPEDLYFDLMYHNQDQYKF